jgi:hypothetical protein
MLAPLTVMCPLPDDDPAVAGLGGLDGPLLFTEIEGEIRAATEELPPGVPAGAPVDGV